jgi:hypothetical protein
MMTRFSANPDDDFISSEHQTIQKLRAAIVPLHELQADVDYLVGRVAEDGSCAPMIATSIKTKLAAIEAALTAGE